jgi:hypothetical protein
MSPDISNSIPKNPDARPLTPRDNGGLGLDFTPVRAVKFSPRSQHSGRTGGVPRQLSGVEGRAADPNAGGACGPGGVLAIAGRCSQPRIPPLPPLERRGGPTSPVALFRTRGMVIIPCSMSTVGKLAAGLSSDLLERAADVQLKERQPLVIVPSGNTVQPNSPAQPSPL